MKSIISVLLLFISALALAQCAFNQPFSKVVNLDNYDKYTLPSAFNNEMTDKPVTVKVGFLVLRMRDFCEKNKEFKVDMVFRQNWTDSRLAHTAPKPYKFDQEFLQKIWSPDTFIVFDHNGRVGQLMKPVALVKVYQDGSVFYSTKITTNMPCTSVEGSDKQLKCELILESYAYPMEEVDYVWNSQSKKQKVFWPMNGFKLVKDIEKVEAVSNHTFGTYKTLKALITVEKD